MEMPKVALMISDEQYKTISGLWAANKEILSAEALHQLGWDDIGAFYTDLIFWGMENAQMNPLDFIMHVRERKNPVFKDLDAVKRVVCGRSDDESLKAYA
jgi:hypothetical protein